MNKKLVSLVLGVLLIVFSVYFKNHQPNQPKVAGVVYDKSIKVEYGVPIKVAEVIDGDTIVLINGDHLRYIGIDTPEEFDERKPVQCFAKEAAEKNRELVEGKMVKIYKDVTAQDRYGRWLGFIYLEDGTFVNKEMIAQGYAFAYNYAPDISKSGELMAAEANARTNKLGLWGACLVTSEKSGREQTNPLE